MSDVISKQMRHVEEGNTREYYIAYTNRQAADHLRDERKKSLVNCSKE